MFDLILNQLSVTFSACHLNFVALAGLGNQVHHQLWMEEFGGNRNSSTENETDKWLEYDWWNFRLKQVVKNLYESSKQ